MTLDELCQEVDQIKIPEEFQRLAISGIKTDSRNIELDNLFVCVNGEGLNGSFFIEDAIEHGAKAVIVENGLDLASMCEGVALLECEDPKKILPILLNRFYADPSQKISVIGITGTNGKTTTSYLIESIYHQAQKLCGVIGTVNYRFDGKVFPAKNTTPGLADNFVYLQKMIDHDVCVCIMEVSSHALMQDRVDGITFDQAVFTNLTSDHLDYHHNQEDYFLAKARFFDGSVDIKNAIINNDDPYGKRLKDIVSGSILTYGIDADADVKAEVLNMSLKGSRFILIYDERDVEIQTSLIGKHNIYNILAAASVCLKEGFQINDIKSGIESLSDIPGRLERIEEAEDVFVFVDYAHTEDALKNVLHGIRKAGATRILTVFGCGGDRDKTKRPKMAAIVEELSDFAIVTNDNPRTEDPDVIKEDILKGFSGNQYEVILDRAQAIEKVLQMANKGDCVLIAGKGHEDYQIFKDETIHFDDREVVRNYLKG